MGNQPLKKEPHKQVKLFRNSKGAGNDSGPSKNLVVHVANLEELNKASLSSIDEKAVSQKFPRFQSDPKIQIKGKKERQRILSGEMQISEAINREGSLNRPISSFGIDSPKISRSPCGQAIPPRTALSPFKGFNNKNLDLRLNTKSPSGSRMGTDSGFAIDMKRVRKARKTAIMERAHRQTLLGPQLSALPSQEDATEFFKREAEDTGQARRGTRRRTTKKKATVTGTGMTSGHGGSEAAKEGLPALTSSTRSLNLKDLKDTVKEDAKRRVLQENSKEVLSQMIRILAVTKFKDLRTSRAFSQSGLSVSGKWELGLGDGVPEDFETVYDIVDRSIAMLCIYNYRLSESTPQQCGIYKFNQRWSSNFYFQLA